MRKAITVTLNSIANSNSIISRTAAPEKITAATARQSTATPTQAVVSSLGSDRIPFSHVPIS